MAKEQRTNAGRIYKSDPAEATYQGSARSLGFNPVKAANDEKKMRDYKAAIIQDGRVINRELLRQQAAENLELKGQQTAAEGALRVGQVKAEGDLKQAQLRAKSTLNLQQNRDFNQRALDKSYLQGQQNLNMSFLKAKGQAESANLEIMSKAVSGLLSFAQSTVDFGQSLNAAREEEESKKIEKMENDAYNAAFFGDNNFGPDQETVDITNAQGEATLDSQRAESQALGESAAELRSENEAFAAYQAEKLEMVSSWNQLADVRGNVFEARMMYTAFISEAAALGLIRPGAQGMADIQALNRKFAKASGLTAAALANPKFVADNFSRQANAEAQNALRMVNKEAATELKAARESKVNNNIAAAWQGINGTSTVAEVGAAWEAANDENVLGSFGGVKNKVSTLSTTQKSLKELADSGRVAEAIRLQRHAPNPDTPNLTLGFQFTDLFGREIRRARQVATSNYNLAQGEQNRKAEQIINSYWEGPRTPESMRQTEAQLREIPTIESRRLADTLVQNGYNYDRTVSPRIAAARGTAGEYTVEALKDLRSKRIISEAEYSFHIKFAPDVATQKIIDEGLNFYKPERSLTDTVTREGGDLVQYGSTPPSPTFKDKLRQKEARFKIELSRRLQAVLRGNEDIKIESEAFQKIMEREAKFLKEQERFQIGFDLGQGGYFFQDADNKTTPYEEGITITPGVQDFTQANLTATQVFVEAKLPKAIVDVTTDRILTPQQINEDTQRILAGEKVSKRTNDWAAAMGMSNKDLINGQRQLNGMTNIDNLKDEEPVQRTAAITPGNKTTGMKDLIALGMPLRGAAYMSSAIQHESAWQAQRPSWDLGAIDNAGRNGGLLSWNRGRLANLERRYGRPVEQITQKEQLAFLMDELERYPKSYNIMMDPNASSPDLQWATWNYIRWNLNYTDNRWPMAEGLIRWGSTNLN